MNSKQSSVRAKGQRTINSTCLFRASKGSGDCNKNVASKAPTIKGPHLSLSDFLNRKLHRNSVLPTSFPGKVVAFSSPLSGQDLDRGAAGEGGKIEGEAKTIVSLDGVFQMFKSVEKSEKDHKHIHVSTQMENLGEGVLQQTRKRKSLVDGHDPKPFARKLLAVLGDDSKPLQTKRLKNSCKKEGSEHLFNHYKTGCGWWNENMEGVDNEEVGCNEVWEGVGSTTLGGIEWH